MRSFKATTSLANGLTKDRASIQHELLKISHGTHHNYYKAHLGKDIMNELKKIKKVKEPLLTAEEKATKVNKAEIKGTGICFNSYNNE